MLIAVAHHKAQKLIKKFKKKIESVIIINDLLAFTLPEKLIKGDCLEIIFKSKKCRPLYNTSRHSYMIIKLRIIIIITIELFVYLNKIINYFLNPFDFCYQANTSRGFRMYQK